jgi:hypothetical protein
MNDPKIVLTNKIRSIMNTPNRPVRDIRKKINEATVIEIAVARTTRIHDDSHLEVNPPDMTGTNRTGRMGIARNRLATAAEALTTPQTSNAQIMGNRKQRRKCTPLEKGLPLRWTERLLIRVAETVMDTVRAR